MDLLAGILFVSAIVFFGMAIVSFFKKNGKAKRRVVFGLGCMIAAVIAIQFTEVGKETHEQAAKDKEAVELSEALDKETESRKAKEKDEATKSESVAAQSEFDTMSDKIVEDSGGIIHSISLKKDESVYLGQVYISEQSWVAATDSEKQSAVVAISNQVKDAAISSGLSEKGSNVFTDFISFENGDLIARENTFKAGFDIKR